MKKGRGRGGGDRIDVWPRSSAIFEALPSAGADAPAKGSICLLGIGVSGTTGDPRTAMPKPGMQRKQGGVDEISACCVEWLESARR